MKTYTEQAYWESANAGNYDAPAANGRGRFATLATTAHSERHFWGTVLPRYIVPDATKTVLEIGSAPGGNLIEFHKRFGHTPYGVEYTPSGAETNRRNFVRHGLDPFCVIQADFFSPEFHEIWDGRFDVVFSRGFVEHFEDLPTVISRHVDLLKPGGRLIVTIPNLAGFNLAMTRRFVPNLVRLHNLALMNLPTFRAGFNDPRLAPLACGYQGGLNLLMADAEPGAVPARLLSWLRKGQLALNVLQCVGTIETRLTSQHLMYVGRLK